MRMHVYCGRCGDAGEPVVVAGGAYVGGGAYLSQYDLPVGWINFKFATNEPVLLCDSCYAVICSGVAFLLKPLVRRKKKK